MKKRKKKPALQNTAHDLAVLLRSYPGMQLALETLKQDMKAKESYLRSAGSVPFEGDRIFRNVEEHLFEYEEMILRSEMLKSRVEGIRRALESLPQNEKTVVTALFLKPCTVETPFELMEQFGIEKSQLYRIRKSALNHFSVSYFGLPMKSEAPTK